MADPTSSSSPRSRSPDTASASPLTAGAVPGRLSRRQSKSERINEILETARERAEIMGGVFSSTSARTPSVSFSPGTTSPALLGRRAGSPAAAAIPEHEGLEHSSPDESTGIVGAGPSRGYATTTTPSLRSRRSGGGTNGRESHELPPSTRDGHALDERAPTTPWWKTFLDNFKSIELENKGSVARDHLALERTFLAWLRTSLAFASIGIAVTQLFRLNTSLADTGDSVDGTSSGRDHQSKTLRRLGKPLGATFLAISILVLFLGFHRYFQSQEWVMKGKFPASRGTIILVSFVAFALMVASLVVVVVVHPSDKEL